MKNGLSNDAILSSHNYNLVYSPIIRVRFTNATPLDFGVAKSCSKIKSRIDVACWVGPNEEEYGEKRGCLKSELIAGTSFK